MVIALAVVAGVDAAVILVLAAAVLARRRRLIDRLLPPHEVRP
jgi:hypothetical protein